VVVEVEGADGMMGRGVPEDGGSWREKASDLPTSQGKFALLIWCLNQAKLA